MLDGLKFLINSKVEISWNDGYYKSNIEDVNDDIISISIPIKDSQYLPLSRGERIEVIYYYANNIYKFYSVVADRKVDRIPLLQIVSPKEVFKIQRRKFVRVPIICSINYEKVVKGTDSSEEKAKSSIFKATMIDLSGGGMKIRLKEDIKTGEELIMHIPMGKETLSIKGQVTRSEKNYDKKLNTCGINFLDLNDRTREKLIKFVFEIMREQMRKGLKGD